MSDKKKILLVEDDAETRSFYADYLADKYTVVTAADGEEGWTKLASGQFDLLLLDIMLPKLDGLVFLERKQKEAKVASVPVVMLTNLGQDEILKKCLGLGAKYYILKAETSPDRVWPVLERALDV